jgi:DNA-binding SARP family transcriptional activator
VWSQGARRYQDRRIRAPRLPPGLTLNVVGPFELACDAGPISLPPSLERLIAYLALHRGPATRLSLSGTLWGDSSDDRAMASLRSALWRLRRAGLPIIDSIGEHVVLSPLVDVDLYELTAVARALLDGSTPRDVDTLDRLASSDELLGDWYDEWLLVERERFRQLRLQALEQMAVDMAAAGRYGFAAESALAAIAAEPLRESAHRALIRVHLAQGNVSEAIRQYAQFRDLIREELDLEPSSQMHDLLGTPLISAAPAPIDEAEASLA